VENFITAVYELLNIPIFNADKKTDNSSRSLWVWKDSDDNNINFKKTHDRLLPYTMHLHITRFRHYR
jgi:hypothetical protein